MVFIVKSTCSVQHYTSIPTSIAQLRSQNAEFNRATTGAILRDDILPALNPRVGEATASSDAKSGLAWVPDLQALGAWDRPTWMGAVPSSLGRTPTL
jgi:hypothetical protein